MKRKANRFFYLFPFFGSAIPFFVHLIPIRSFFLLFILAVATPQYPNPTKFDLLLLIFCSNVCMKCGFFSTLHFNRHFFLVVVEIINESTMSSDNHQQMILYVFGIWSFPLRLLCALHFFSFTRSMQCVFLWSKEEANCSSDNNSNHKCQQESWDIWKKRKEKPPNEVKLTRIEYNSMNRQSMCAFCGA